MASSAYQKAMRVERFKKGLCTGCGKDPPREGGKYCQQCLDGSKRRNEKWTRSNPNLCRRCGEPKGDVSTKWCVECKYKRKEENRKKKQEGLLCTTCYCRPKVGGRSSCVECTEDSIRYRQKVKDEAFAAYGGYKCLWCGCEDPMVLQLDHINDDGNVHRSETKTTTMYAWLRANDYPPIMQVLCSNCNWRKRWGVKGPSELSPTLKSLQSFISFDSRFRVQ